MASGPDADEEGSGGKLEASDTPGANPKRQWDFLCGRTPGKLRKPPSNPPGWAAGKSTVYDLAKRPNRIVVINGEQETEFVPNMVRTAKYEYYNFLPKFLWEEFNPATKIANVYFLFIAALQVVPSITNTFGIPMMLLPLFFVVCVDAVFMIVEDVARHRADNYANSSPTLVWDRHINDFKLITWKEIEVGNLIVINNREPVPCDVLIMGVDEPLTDSPAGIAYVETKSLDGETNLKIRQVVKGIIGTLVKPGDCSSLSGQVVMEHPDKLINNFKGKLLLHSASAARTHADETALAAAHTLPPGATAASGTGDCGDGASSPGDIELTAVGAARAGAHKGGGGASIGDVCDTSGKGGRGESDGGAAAAAVAAASGTAESSTSEPISPDMLLLRGCVLRNTRWVLGLVLNTGPDTKIMMSMSKAPSKASHLSNRINEEIKRVAGVMGIVCVLGASLSTVWSSRYLEDKWYLRWNDDSSGLAEMFFTQFLYYCLLLNSFIPISLYVSMNFVRFLQAWFMNQDLDMYYADADTPARVRTMNLNEDLGQVSHIFSDKTGTLTCNVMDFRKFSVGGISYGLGITEIGRAAMVVDGKTVPQHVLEAEQMASNHAVPHVNFYDPTVYTDLQGAGEAGEKQAAKIRDFFTALALCHTVIPERFEDSDEVMLSASSPDDEALVLGAKYFGFEFINRIDSSAIINTWDVTAPPPPAAAAAHKGPRPSLNSGVVIAAPSSITAPAAAAAGSGSGSGSHGDATGGEKACFSSENVAADQLHPTPIVAVSPAGGDSATAIAAVTTPVIEGLDKVAVDGATACPPSAPQPAPPGAGPADPRESAQADDEARSIRGPSGEGGVSRAASEGLGGSAAKVTPVSYEVLHVLGFTSDRKRMSVIVRTEEGTIKIICKGADTVMLPRLRRDRPGEKESIEATVEHMDVFAREGLRTLVVAQAEIDPRTFEEWSDRYDEASNDLVEIEKRNMGEPNRIEGMMDVVERDLEIIGSSAIEDKLQGGVADAVADLMAAGIKIWVLTGDKEETAINIAVACQLLWTEAKMHRTVINLRGTGESETDEIKQALEDFLSTCIEERNRFEEDKSGTVKAPLPRGLVIDGPALLEAMQTPESQVALLRAAQTCHSVVGCRLSPDQKRALVSLVRENVPGTRTLSIGDGANDVPMIQRAHIGVGISGQEGMQAVNASDYAIAQFAYLRKLLLVHGRWNYRRSSRVVCYLFYKSVMFACPLIFYAFVNGFSGTLFYDYVTTNLYAVVYTALPILLYGIYDRDISAETCLRYPQLYAYGIKDGCMRPKIFWSWMLQALLESAFLTFAPLFLLSGDPDGKGVVTSTFDYGTMTFALVVLQVSFKMFWVQYRWTRVHVLVLVGSVLAFFLSSFLVNVWVLINWDYRGVLNALLQSRPYWAVMIWCLAVVSGRDWVFKFHHRWWRPRLHHLVLESDKSGVRTGSGKEEFGHEGKKASSTDDGNMAAAAGGGDGGGGGGGVDDLEAAKNALSSAQGPHAQTGGNGTDQYGNDEDEEGARTHGARRHHRPKQRTATSTPQAPAPGQAFPPSHRSVASEDQDSAVLDPTTGVEHLLQSTFVRPGGQAGAPVTVSALSETLRERRGNREQPYRNVFGASLPRSRHIRRATSGVDGGSGSGGSGGSGGSRAFNQTGGQQAALTRPVVGRDNAGGGGRGRRQTEVAQWIGTGQSALEQNLDDEGAYEDDEWDPFATAPGRAAGRASPPAPQTKSDMLLSVGDLADRDPREAAKLMTKSSFFVAVGEGAPLSVGDRRRRDSDRGAAAPATPDRRRFSRRDNRRKSNEARVPAASAAAATAAATSAAAGGAGARHKASGGGPWGGGGGGGGGADLSTPCSTVPSNSTGGYAFSCDAKAQRAEIAMILGRRASPMPRTVPLEDRRSSLKVERIGRAGVSTSSALPANLQGSFAATVATGATAMGAGAGGDIDSGGGRGSRAPMIYRHASYTAGSERSLLSGQSFGSRSKRSADMTTADVDTGASSAAAAATSIYDDFGELKLEEDLGQDEEHQKQEQEQRQQGEQQVLPVDQPVEEEHVSGAGDHS